MAITGHKSSSSLKVYQHVDEQKKLQMGTSLGVSLTNTPSLPMLPAPPPPAIIPAIQYNQPQAKMTPLQIINVNQLKNVLNPNSAIIPYMIVAWQKRMQQQKLKTHLVFLITKLSALYRILKPKMGRSWCPKLPKSWKLLMEILLFPNTWYSRRPLPKYPWGFKDIKLMET